MWHVWKLCDSEYSVPPSQRRPQTPEGATSTSNTPSVAAAQRGVERIAQRGRCMLDRLHTGRIRNPRLQVVSRREIQIDSFHSRRVFLFIIRRAADIHRLNLQHHHHHHHDAVRPQVSRECRALQEPHSRGSPLGLICPPAGEFCCCAQYGDKATIHLIETHAIHLIHLIPSTPFIMASDASALVRRGARTDELHVALHEEYPSSSSMVGHMHTLSRRRFPVSASARCFIAIHQQYSSTISIDSVPKTKLEECIFSPAPLRHVGPAPGGRRRFSTLSRRGTLKDSAASKSTFNTRLSSYLFVRRPGEPRVASIASMPCQKLSTPDRPYPYHLARLEDEALIFFRNLQSRSRTHHAGGAVESGVGVDSPSTSSRNFIGNINVLARARPAGKNRGFRHSMAGVFLASPTGSSHDEQ
ncbi:hypothetical protein K504DRAFT_501586 [Pleomassaria siparia CBS 279.74]|uniref:Uncharacterized protein n=1 Tax=Pleomassaria siparia CBS 279.74 TaxID=1314801 RepID=A0A6G1KCZ9_9PLEO|nr:hypothetical protein K504DRAFT_501586 [Pleomassaria siparia CBS 279.74]